MDLSRIDWNLVPVLDALLNEQNVSRAARRLGISQPAASKALARLRRLYADELLVRRGNAYRLTPLGEQLAPAAREAVGAVRSVIGTTNENDAAALTRSFTIAASDYAQAVLIPSLRDMIADRAPGVRVDFVHPFAVAPAETGVLPHVDGWISPRELFDDHPHTGRLSDTWACIVDAAHPAAERGLMLEDLARYAWVVPTVAGRRLILQLDGLRAHGAEAGIRMSTDSFVAVPFIVAGTDRIGLLQRRLGLLLEEAAGVRVLPCPWAVPPLNSTFWYDESRETDPVHRWLRELIAECMAGLSALDEPSRS